MSNDPITSIKDRISAIEAEKNKLEAQLKQLSSKEFKVGDWVYCKDARRAYRIAQIHTPNSEPYSTFYRETKDSSVCSYRARNLVHATNDQIRHALEKRAKDQGFVPGARFKYLDCGEFTLSHVHIVFDIKDLGRYESYATKDYLRKNNYVAVLMGTVGNCCPMEESQLLPPLPKYPKINGYDGKENDKCFVYGCAGIDKELIKDLNEILTSDYTGNRTIASVTLNSGVSITKSEIMDLAKTLKSK